MTENKIKGNSTRLWSFFEERCRVHSPVNGLAAGGELLSFSRLRELSELMARNLAQLGVKDGDLIGLVYPNAIEFPAILLALFRSSAAVALISAKYQAAEIEAIAANLRPAFFIAPAAANAALHHAVAFRQAHPLDPGAGASGPQLLVPDYSKFAIPHSLPADNALSAELAVIKFTSGSTGVPKGIGLTADNILAETENVISTLQITGDDRIMAPVPISHSYGFDLGVLAALASGSSLFLQETFVPRLIMREIAARKISIFLGVPSMYRFFLETSFSNEPDLKAVRYLLSCTAPLSAELINQFHDRFGVPICQHYGSSESGAASTHVPAEVLRRPDSVGRAMSGVRLSLLDPSGKELPPGDEGEIVVRSKAVAPGYVLGKPADRNPLELESYRTGDFGYMDSDGFLYVRGRIDGLINVGGLKVAPLEVTQVLESHPAVREAAVIGVAAPSGEQVVYGAVVLRADITEAELHSFCRTRLAEYKVPRRIDILEDLPRTATGKPRLDPEKIKW